MTQNKHTTLFVIAASAWLAWSVTAVANTPTAEPNADAIVDNIQKYYQDTADYRADFVQTTAHKMFAGQYQRAYGRVMFKNGLMRWEYDRPEKKLFVYDGAALWIYEPQVPQVFKGAADAERLKKALAFLTGQGKIKDAYRAKKASATAYGFSEGYVLLLTPKEKNSPFKQVELYVDKGSFSVVRSVVIDHEGNRNRLDFSNSQTNTSLKDSLFQFKPAAGVPVLSAE
ncbi:MAG: outer membrane lipoprotein chaperone LolA [Myxococcales bacterium]|jgi:outer membrane lipoprotein carrier protein|nr:outer membrane lipoprotein chaperone LolA [Myxococcales bacterium]